MNVTCVGRRRAFLDAIIADPADDAPRLVFADWLEENGDESERARAEFIRVQCAMTGATRCGRNKKIQWCSDPECYGCILRSREEVLWGDYIAQRIDTGQDRWGMPFPWKILRWSPGEMSCGIVEAKTTRGFISSVTMSAYELLQHGRDIASHTPLEQIKVTGKKPTLTMSEETWVWYSSGVNFYAEALPSSRSEIAKSKIPALWLPDNKPWSVEFPTEQAAQDWLNAQALRWVRSKE